MDKKIMINALCTGVVSGVAVKLLFGEYGTADYFVIPMDVSLATGLATGVGSIASDLGSEMVLKRIGLSDQLYNGSSLFVKAGVCGAVSTATLYMGGSENIVGPFVLGAGSKMAGDWVYDKVFDIHTGFIPL